MNEKSTPREVTGRACRRLEACLMEEGGSAFGSWFCDRFEYKVAEHVGVR